MKLAQKVATFITAAGLGFGAAAAQSDGNRLSPPSATRPPDGDGSYVNKAKSIASFERQAGQIALARSTDPAVRTFAERLVTDSDFQDKMLRLSTGALSPTSSLSTLMPEQQAMLSQLSSSRSNFGGVFRNLLLTAEQESIDLHSRYAGEGNSPDLRAFASNTASLTSRRKADLQALALSETHGSTAAMPTPNAAAVASRVVRNTRVALPAPQPVPPPPRQPVKAAGTDSAPGAPLTPAIRTEHGASGDEHGGVVVARRANGGAGTGDLTRGPLQIAGNIDARDYPPAAINELAQGTVLFHFIVRPNGHISDCGVDHSSGSARLDDLTCRLALRRFRFRPALDAMGRPVAAQARGEQAWQLGPVTPRCGTGSNCTGRTTKN